jgi:predicted anti-sigma-YlaC factor YlaD
MRDQHITSLFEEKPISRLSAGELATIEAHVAACDDCLRSYRAARLAESLIEARSAEAHAAPPFFKTRVMAAIRERRLSTEPTAWLRIWRAAGSMLTAMAMLVVVLAGLTVFNYGTVATTPPDMAIGQNVYSPDEVVFGQDDVSEETYDQVIGTIYDSEDGDGN